MKVARGVTAAAALAYPFVSHFGTTSAKPTLPLLWLAALFLMSYLANPRSLGWLALSAGTLGAVTFSLLYGYEATILRLPPILICGAFALLFGRTLLPGRRPLISHIGAQLRGQLPPAADRYGRLLTWIWTLFFIGMGLESLLLAIFASPYWWSLFTNFLNYGFIALLFVAEYPIRRIILRDMEHTSFIDSLRGSLSVRLR
jgi:uncharacterized membrane protein